MPGAPDVPRDHGTLPDDDAIVEARESTLGNTFGNTFVIHALVFGPHVAESAVGR
jgi:hypothetical protein